MRKVLLLGLMATVLFGASAGVSWYLQQMKEAKDGTTADTEKAAAADSASNSKSSGLAAAKETPSGTYGYKSVARPTYNPEAEAAVQRSLKLNEQEEQLRKREQQFAIRQKQLELIRADIRGEQATIDDLRKQVAEELKALDERLGMLEHKSSDLDQQKQETTKQLKEMQKSLTEYEKDEQERIKQVSSMYDSMEPESAAKILQQLADTGNLDMAVKILATMKERQAAKVLALLPESNTGGVGLAAQLLDKLKGLKKPSTGSSTQTKK